METRHLTCISCPIGCALTVTLEDGAVTAVEGNTCPRGKAYAESEVLHPARVLTTTVRVGEGYACLPVKSAAPLPKERLMECMALINAVRVQPPVRIGDVVLANVGGTGVDIVATGNIV
jgi:CxxC motif-containing protein